MPELRLKSFEVEGFRALRHVCLPELGRVNLLVGKNNSGKTSLLEAVRLFTSRSPAAELLEILRTHGAPQPGLLSFGREEDLAKDEVAWAVEVCRGIVTGGFDRFDVDVVRLSEAASTGRLLTISVPWLASYRTRREDELFFVPETPVIRLSSGHDVRDLTLAWLLRSVPAPRLNTDSGVVHVPSTGLGTDDLFLLWRSLAAGGEAAGAETALRRLVPALERVLLLPSGLSLQMESAPRPFPLESLGEGTHRAFGFALSLLRARGGTVLIDEVENGLHHTIQHQVWDLLFDLAEELDVQVFATTHSWETVVAFQHAANRSPARGMLYRLEHGSKGIRVERYTEEDVAIAAEYGIEVR
jgi:hypothetical protein